MLMIFFISWMFEIIQSQPCPFDALRSLTVFERCFINDNDMIHASGYIQSLERKSNRCRSSSTWRMLRWSRKDFDEESMRDWIDEIMRETPWISWTHCKNAEN
jgi:hypothetical protein